MKASRFIPHVVVLLVIATSLHSQPAPHLDKELPVDPSVTIGTLDNGLRYYIRENRKPENRAELRLVVNAGSVLEEEDQRGLAHFVEHMAFNGTKNFEKNALVRYMERVGMRFGPDVNAYTSFDETVYMLQIPTDSASIVETAFQILEDWAHQVSFDDEEIDKERGVVVEEWRLGRGAGARMFDKQAPVLFKDSRYAERLPIGKKEILEGAPYERLRSFYRTWYRPDLMAVIAVGDFDKAQIERTIRRQFSRIPAPSKKIDRPTYPVPPHAEPLFAIATDPEATSTSISVYYKHELMPQGHLRDYRRTIIETLYNGMLNQRLSELTKRADPPFLFASSQKGRFVRSMEAYFLGASVREGQVERGLQALLTEAARVRTHGFTATEMERQKLDMMRSMERTYHERDKTESRRFASEYVRHFLSDEPIPGIESEYKLFQMLLPGITLEEVNALAARWITNENRVVLVSAPEKPGVPVPTGQDLAAVFAAVTAANVELYIDDVSDKPLVPSKPKAGRVEKRVEHKDLGVTEWMLSNGVRVVLKPTDFKNDEVLFTSFSPGGHSLVEDKHHIAASTASTIIQESGVGTFDLITLQKALAGKLVNVSPFISELEEGISGNASPEDLETMFQLIYLFFTSPRADSSAYLAYQTRLKTFVQNRSARPETSFEDTVQVTMSQYHFRRRPWTEAVLREMDLGKSLQVYRDRFADASDFTFIFVGNITPESLEHLVTTYLGGLPSKRRGESWRDVGVRPPRGVIKKTVHRGMEPKSQVRMIFTGPFEFDVKNRYEIQSMANALRIRLREALREEKGGTYGVGVSAATFSRPRPEYRLTVSFGCAPDRVEELIATAMEQIDSLRNHDLDDEYLTRIKETQRRERETNLKQNRYWLSTLQTYYSEGEDPMQIITYGELIESLNASTIRAAALRYIDKANYVNVVLYPASDDALQP
jgi:zinc protease